MPTLLHIEASPRGDFSVSRQIAAAAVDAWKKKNPNGKVMERDLAHTHLPFVDTEWIVGAFTPPDRHAESHKKAIAISDELVAELLAADEIVIGTPMYNFAVPATLKAWIDHIVRAGRTFQYKGSGAEGLANGRKVVVVVASGGAYKGVAGMEANDFLVPYLRFVLGFIGISDVTFVRAGGVAAVDRGQVAREAFLAPFIQEAAAAIG